jgi:hypothetical protein
VSVSVKGWATCVHACQTLRSGVQFNLMHAMYFRGAAVSLRAGQPQQQPPRCRFCDLLLCSLGLILNNVLPQWW